MKRRTLSFMLTDLALASWETIAHRMGQMARGTCTPAEYRRMVTEKLLAAQRSTLALMRPGGNRAAAALAPWRSAAKRNAKRLRRRRR
jgi:hypothetical protein